MKVAIYGGSFNPIHEGHLSVAKQALKKGIADEVWFMPTAYTPLKESSMAASKHRIAMIQRAIAPFKKMKVSLHEIERDDTSYTMDTVHHLLKKYPKIEFCWLIGNDQAKQFTKWKSYKELLDTLDFYVFSRGDEPVDLLKNMYEVPMDLVDVSSTEIREGKKLYLLPKPVKAYIRENGLYLDSFVQSHMSKKRYEHTKRVAYLASCLAQLHGVDKEEAYLAGLLHDVCKEFSEEEMLIYMKRLDEKYMSYPKGIWHGFIAPMYIRRNNVMISKEVATAIFHHVLGDGTTKLAKILFISDKIEPGRDYDSSHLLELAKLDIDAACDKIKEETQEYLKGKGVIQ